MILHLLPTELRALHLLVGTVIWAALVTLVFHSSRTSRASEVSKQDPSIAEPALSGSEGLPRDDSTREEPSLAADLVTLTKPRIISLLLVTTVAPMLCDFNSPYSVSVSASSPALVTLYGPMPGAETMAAIDAMFTICAPRGFCFIQSIITWQP